MKEKSEASAIYRRLRWRLMLWYVLLSGITSLALVLLGTYLCYSSINNSLNKELEDLIASNLPEIVLKNNQPQFLFSNKSLSSQWAHQHSTIQLYDRNGNFIQEFGPPGVRRLELQQDYFEDTANGVKVRATCDPISAGNALIGYIQAEVPVEIRDTATLDFARIMVAIMPVLLLVLGFSGYFLSGKSSRPAEHAFMLLKQFLADASHEMRTPVHAIQLTAENVAADSAKDSQLAKDMEIIVQATDRLARLIDDMLLLTKLELHQLPVRKQPVSIDRLLVESIETMKPAFLEKNLDLQLGTLEPSVVEGDADALYRVICNLLQNALRYTDSGGQVRIDLKSSNNLVHLCVADNGIGIDAASLPHIFERFYRVDKSRARAVGGSGLGLSIAKAICEQHKGTIAVASQEGIGTTFTVILPRAEAIPAQL